MNEALVELRTFHARVTQAHTSLPSIRAVKEWFLMNVAEGCGLHPDVIMSYLKQGYCEERTRQTIATYMEAAAVGATMTDDEYLRIVLVILRNDLDPYSVAMVIQPYNNRDTDEWETLMNDFKVVT